MALALLTLGAGTLAGCAGDSPRALEEPGPVHVRSLFGLYASGNAGVSWERLGKRSGLLAWPAAEALYLATADGGVYRSRDGGTRFTRRSVVATPSAFLATDATTLYLAAHHDDTVYVSRDGGRSWTVRSRSKPSAEEGDVR